MIAEAKAMKEKMMKEAEASYDENGEFDEMKPVKTPGNLGTAIAPSAVGSAPAEAWDFATSPMPVQIVGTGQEMGLAGNDLAASQAIMEENRSQAASSGGGGAPIVAPTVTNNTSSSVTNVAGAMPSTRDYTDWTMAYRPAGNSR